MSSPTSTPLPRPVRRRRRTVRLASAALFGVLAVLLHAPSASADSGTAASPSEGAKVQGGWYETRGADVNVRDCPYTRCDVVDRVSNERVYVRCQTLGEYIRYGDYEGPLWSHISIGRTGNWGYISNVFIDYPNHRLPEPLC